MITIDISAYARNELNLLRYGVYVMQNCENQNLYRAGVCGINRGNNNAWNRLLQNGNRRNIMRWRYVFFASEGDKYNKERLYAAEHMLHGNLCRSFQGIGNSRLQQMMLLKL